MEMVSQYYSSEFDAIVIGAGHNGLIFCFFLHYVLIRHESALALYLSRGGTAAAAVLVMCPHKYYHLDIQLNGADASYNQAFRELVG
jgi:hypothetical protein